MDRDEREEQNLITRRINVQSLHNLNGKNFIHIIVVFSFCMQAYVVMHVILMTDSICG